MTILHESPECYIQQCSECGAVLKYSKNDIYIADKLHEFEDGESYYASFDFIRCPACGQVLMSTKEWLYDQFNLKNQ